ncbi:hypothetical protein MMK92_000280 [Escherichia coli]|nr:hypothetical protein [Escherichia coli]
MMNYKKILFYVYVASVLISTSSVYMINSSDFSRAIFPFMDAVKSFRVDIPLHYDIKPKFSSIASYQYISSYSYMMYAIVYALSFITRIFDLQMFSAVLKFIYISSLYYLFVKISKTQSFNSVIVFILLSIPLVSSSNISMLSSFYQEQVILIFMPMICMYIIGNDNKSILFVFLGVVIVSCAKSQFFYAPVVAFFSYLLFNRDRIILKTGLLTISLVLSVTCIILSSGATSFNKYHANFYGVYQYAKEHNIELDADIDKSCIGIDAWGNRFDLAKGAVATDIGTRCYDKNTSSGFSDAIGFVIRNPSFLINLPFDDGMRSQYTEDYFHVFKSIQLVRDDNSVSGSITYVKDYLFKNIRFIILAMLLLVSIIKRRMNVMTPLFFTSCFGVTQLYIAFMGEGYRDLSKHLFGMNFSFDLSIFIILSIVYSKFSKASAQ